MKNPTVSIVVPTYRRREELSRALESILQQTYTDWELIVVNDDPDTDVGDLLPDDNRVSYIHHSNNQGAPASRNDGISNSSGEFVALLDDDDKWKPTKLEKQVNNIQSRSKEYGLIYTGRDIIRDGEVIERYIPDEEGNIFELLLHENVIPSETPLIKLECFDEVGGFDPDLESGQDLDMWLRIARQYKIGAVSESLAVSYQDAKNRISEDMEKKFNGKQRLLKKYSSPLNQHPEAISIWYRQVGIYATRTSRRKEALQYYIMSLSNEFYWPTIIYVATLLLPAVVRDEVFDLLDHVGVYGKVEGIYRWMNCA